MPGRSTTDLSLHERDKSVELLQLFAERRGQALSEQARVWTSRHGPTEEAHPAVEPAELHESEYCTPHTGADGHLGVDRDVVPLGVRLEVLALDALEGE